MLMPAQPPLTSQETHTLFYASELLGEEGIVKKEGNNT